MKIVRLAVLSIVSVSLAICVATAADAPDSAKSEDAPEITVLRENALLGIGDAQYKLGLAYIDGRGVAADPVEGFVWLRLAAEKGVTGKALHTVLESLTADQLKAARQLMATLRADNPSLRPGAPPAQPATTATTPQKSTAVESVAKSPELAPPTSVTPPATTNPAATPVVTLPFSSTETKRPQAPLPVGKEVKGPVNQKAASEAKDVSQVSNDSGKETNSPIVFSVGQGSARQVPSSIAQRPAEVAPERSDVSAARPTPGGESSPVSIEVPKTTVSDAATKEAAAALQRERNAHFVTQAALEQLRTQLTELTSSRATMEREFNARIAAAERRQHDSTAEVGKRAAEKAALSDKVSSLAAELRDARSELATVRENLAATSAKAVSSESQASEIATLKNRLSSSSSELEAAKSALAAAERSQRDAAADVNKRAAEKAEFTDKMNSLAAELRNARAELVTVREKLAATSAKAVGSEMQASEIAALKKKLSSSTSELNDAKAALAAAERSQRDAAADVNRRAAEKAEFFDKVNSLAAELRDARSELVTVRENLAATSAKAVSSEMQASEIATLKKKLVSSSDELQAAKAALAVANSKAQSAESRMPSAAQADQLNSLRTEVRVLERDLQSATAALRRMTTDKATLETALFSANQQLASANNELPTLRQRVAEANYKFANGGGQDVIGLRGELNETKFRLATAEKQVRQRDEELNRLRVIMAAADSRSAPSTSDTEAARRAANEAKQQLAVVTQELASLRPQAAAARELETRLRQLEGEKASAQLAQSNSNKEEVARLTAAQAAAEEKLSTTLKSFAAISKERDEFRAQASAARELQARVRQLESEKGSVPNKEEFARLVAAQAAAETRLSTTLRSYTLLAKERDELRARLAQLSAPPTASTELPRSANVAVKSASAASTERRTEAR
jgi:predicted  nucleic acid-binding Zn-ribbon protein